MTTPGPLAGSHTCSENILSPTPFPKRWGRLALLSAETTGEILVLSLSSTPTPADKNPDRRLKQVPQDTSFLSVLGYRMPFIHSFMCSKIILEHPAGARARHMGKEGKRKINISGSPGLGRTPGLWSCLLPGCQSQQATGRGLPGSRSRPPASREQSVWTPHT